MQKNAMTATKRAYKSALNDKNNEMMSRVSSNKMIKANFFIFFVVA
jgi:hypothetical protein